MARFDALVFSPVTGTVVRIFDEWAGTQIQIAAARNSSIIIALFHIKLSTPVVVGQQLTAGADVSQTWEASDSCWIAQC